MHEFENDARLKPLVDIVNAVEAPDVDYASPQVQRIIHDIHKLDKDVAVPPPGHPSFKTVPFDLAPEAEDPKIGRDTIFKTKTKPFQDDPDIEEVIGADEFRNWGKNISFRASYTLVVHTIEGVCKVVKWAAFEGRRVRVTGFRHSWRYMATSLIPCLQLIKAFTASDVFAANGDVLIMFLPYDTLVDLPYQDPPPTFKTKLAGITAVPSVAGRSPPPRHSFYKVMAGTTNEQFRQWCFDDRKFCLPLNVIMVEVCSYHSSARPRGVPTCTSFLQVTFGGTNAPICHGSGLSTTTLSDLVVEVEYVDANGVVQTVNDPTELLAASGAFGLLGVVVSITLQLDEMGVTNMMPVKLPLPLAIPPPKDYAIPYEVQKIIEDKKITVAQLADAQKEFERRCEQDYYLEWFWFPYQADIWVNTWSSTCLVHYFTGNIKMSLLERSITSSDIDISAYPGDGLLDGVQSQQVCKAFTQPYS